MLVDVYFTAEESFADLLANARPSDEKFWIQAYNSPDDILNPITACFKSTEQICWINKFIPQYLFHERLFVQVYITKMQYFHAFGGGE